MNTNTPTPQLDIDEMLVDAFQDFCAPEKLCTQTVEQVRAYAGTQGKEHAHAAQGFKRAKMSHIVAAAAAFMLVGMCIVGYGAWTHVVTIVSIDVNPSLELSLNRFERVVDVQAVNTDAEEIAGRVDIYGMTCEDAVAEVLDDKRIRQSVKTGIDQGYSSDESAVEITVVPMHHAGHNNECSVSTQRAIDRAGCPCRLAQSDAEEYEQAARMGLSVGKYRMYVTLVDDYPQLTPEDVAGMSMRELRVMAGECTHGLSDEAHESSDGYTDEANGAVCEEEGLRSHHKDGNPEGHKGHHNQRCN